MSEVAIILSDLHAGPDARIAAPEPLPGLTRLGRFGRTAVSGGGWRAWLAGWLGRADLARHADAAPAVVAGFAPDVAGPALDVAGSAPGAEAGSVWLAQPVQLMAGMRSVHLPYQGLLQVAGEEAAGFVREFDASFGAHGFTLRPASGGGFLARGPHFAELPVTTDPARLLGQDIAGSTPQGMGAAPLLRLGAELEMWLYSHPLNGARARARRSAISTLWLWGGGAPAALAADRAAANSAVLGADAFAAGLCGLSGAQHLPQAADAPAALAACARFERVALITPLFRPPADAPAARAPATVHELLALFDRGLLQPLLDALAHGRLERLLFMAGGRVTALAPRDGLRFWRRPRGALAVLQ